MFVDLIGELRAKDCRCEEAESEAEIGETANSGAEPVGGGEEFFIRVKKSH